MDLKEFSAQHGGLVLVIRRHFESRKVAAVKSIIDKSVAIELRLGRHLDDAQQGLSSMGAANAFTQGAKLAHLGLVPVAIITGWDQRNLDGGLATAEGIADASGPAVPVYRNPGVTYPYYGDPQVGTACLAKWGDPAVHRHLSGALPETRGLWVESVSAFHARLMGAIEGVTTHSSEFGDGFELWDLNYEQMVLLHQTLVAKRPLEEIDIDDPYDPDYGAGIAIAKDGAIVEFTRELQIGPSTEAKS